MRVRPTEMRVPLVMRGLAAGAVDACVRVARVLRWRVCGGVLLARMGSGERSMLDDPPPPPRFHLPPVSAAPPFANTEPPAVATNRPPVKPHAPHPRVLLNTQDP